MSCQASEVDFNNCDKERRVRLNTIGAIRSLNESQVALRNGLEVELASGDFFPIKGIVEYSDSERIWVARFSINDLRDKEMASPSENPVRSTH
jgi:transcription antitermination factor NusG